MKMRGCVVLTAKCPPLFKVNLSITMIIAIVMTCSLSVSAQRGDSLKNELLRAVELMEEGQTDSSRTVLEVLKDENPKKETLYDYEIAYSYYLEEDYKKVKRIGKKLVKRDDKTDLCYQLLGNAYDFSGRSKKAIKTYEKGLEVFPGSGKLHLERGNMELFAENYDEALRYYEEGISAEPAFPSNYYWASKIHLSTDNAFWGMIYGELFLNLEYSGRRHVELSNILYKSYENRIDFSKGDTITAKFASNVIRVDPDVMNTDRGMELFANSLKRLAGGFGLLHYEPLMAMSVIGERQIEISSLDNIRTRFLELYFEDDRPDVVLFDRQKEIYDAGHFEAYNHWLFADADEPGFTVWASMNREKLDDFIRWFSENPLVIDQENKFVSIEFESEND